MLSWLETDYDDADDVDLDALFIVQAVFGDSFAALRIQRDCHVLWMRVNLVRGSAASKFAQGLVVLQVSGTMALDTYLPYLLWW